MSGKAVSICACAAAMWTIMSDAQRSLAQSPFATQVISYDAGATPVTGYTDPAAAIGRPERMTGENTPYLGAVTMFNAPWLPSEVVSVGEGGHITLQFDTPITDDPANPYGQDFILFTNAGFIDLDYPNGLIGGIFGNDDAIVEISADQSTWFPVSHNLADGIAPTQGFLDVGPFDTAPGSVKTNLLQPIDPSLTFADFAGLTYAQALALYGTSGGGTSIDIASTGLAAAQYVRISVPDDGNPEIGLNFELDAISVVPEPATAGMLAAATLLLCRRRRR